LGVGPIPTVPIGPLGFDRWQLMSILCRKTLRAPIKTELPWIWRFKRTRWKLAARSLRSGSRGIAYWTLMRTCRRCVLGSALLSAVLWQLGCDKLIDLKLLETADYSELSGYGASAFLLKKLKAAISARGVVPSFVLTLFQTFSNPLTMAARTSSCAKVAIVLLNPLITLTWLDRRTRRDVRGE
jgi:hypothetical protein